MIETSEDFWYQMEAPRGVSNALNPPDPSKLDPIHTSRSVWIGSPAQWINGDMPESGIFVRNGKIVTTETALQVSAVWQAMDVQAKAIAASDWTVARRSGKRKFEILWDDRLTYILNTRPNPDMSAQSFKRAMVMGVCGWGNGYAEILRDLSNRPAGLYPIHPERVVRAYRKTPTSAITWVIDQLDGNFVEVESENMYHIRGPSVVGLVGAHKIGLAAASIALYMATHDFQSAYFNNGGKPGGVLEYTGTLDDTAFERLKKEWASRHEGPENAFKTAILDGGGKYTAIPNDASKSQTIESRDANVVEIARWFGVPPHKLGHMSDMTMNNVEHLGRDFVNDCLRPIAREMQEELDHKLLRGRPGMYSIIDLDWQMQGSFKERAEGFRELRNAGVMNGNEIRDEFNLGDMGPDGERYIVQGAMIDISEVGLPYRQKVEADTGKAAGKSGSTVAKAWLRNAYVRLGAYMRARVNDAIRNGAKMESARADAIASGPEYIRKMVSEMSDVYGESVVDAVVAMGVEVMKGKDVDSAITEVGKCFA